MSKTFKVVSAGGACIALAFMLLGALFVSEVTQAQPASAWEGPVIELTGGACEGGVRATPITVTLTNRESGFQNDPGVIKNVSLVGDPTDLSIPSTLTFSPNPVPNTGDSTSTAQFTVAANYSGLVKGQLDFVFQGDSRFVGQKFEIYVQKCVEATTTVPTTQPTTTTTEPETTTTTSTVVTTTSTTQPTTTSTTQPSTTSTSTTSTTQPTTTTTKPSTTTTTEATTTTTEPKTTTTTAPTTSTTVIESTTTTAPSSTTSSTAPSSTTTEPQTSTTVCGDSSITDETTPSGETCTPVVPAAPAPPATTNGGPLPITGGAQGLLVFIAGLLVVIGLATLLAARRISAS